MYQCFIYLSVDVEKVNRHRRTERGKVGLDFRFQIFSGASAREARQQSTMGKEKW